MKAPDCILLFLGLCACRTYGDFLVYPRLLDSRNEDGTLVLHVHEGLTFNLEKTTILAEELVITSSTDEVSQTVFNGRKLEERLYHDSQRQCAVAIRQLEDSIEVRGLLNHHLVIAPVNDVQRPDGGVKLHKVVDLTERSASSEERSKTSTSSESAQCEENALNGYRTHQRAVSSDADKLSSSGTEANRTKKLDKFIVEVCFVTDEEYTKTFKTITDLIEYLATMLNAVALRYVDMEEPKIGFQLNHIFTNMSKEVITTEEDFTDINNTLYNMKGLEEQGMFNDCDAALFLTSKHLYFKETERRTSVSGIAFIGTVCGEEKVAVAHDKPHSFIGAGTVAHEFGHILGAFHDGTSEKLEGYADYPGAESCRDQDGYLMSTFHAEKNRYTLSNCSRKQIRVVYRNLSQECIAVRKQPCYTTDVYPGQNMTRRQFCKFVYLGDPTAKPDVKHSEKHEQCLINCCWSDDELGIKQCFEFDLPDGIKCSPGKTCRRGVCKKHKWKSSTPPATSQVS